MHAQEPGNLGNRPILLADELAMGIGRTLIKAAKEYAASRNAWFLTVKTIAASKIDQNYTATRAFYESVGFLPVEEFPTFWDQDHPCLFMIHPLELRA